jgi:ParB family chromosome partitioning protein
MEKIMARKIGLGRGLDALLPNPGSDIAEIEDSPENSTGNEDKSNGKAAEKAGDGVVLLSTEKLQPNPGQPRKNFDEAELRELADSIAEHGIIQPIIAADNGDGSYIIIAGERRTRAARLAGLAEIPAIIRDYTDQKRLEISLIENIQRSDLNPIEEAAAYKNLMDFSGLSQDEVALKVGKNRSTVANALRLLKLSADVQKSLEQGSISPGHARALLSVIDKNSREKLYREILADGPSVREVEKRAAALNAAPEDKVATANEKKAPKRPPEITEMEEKVIGRLGTKVIVDGDLNKGRIHIDYYSMEDLERLYEILGPAGSE